MVLFETKYFNCNNYLIKLFIYIFFLIIHVYKSMKYYKIFNFCNDWISLTLLDYIIKVMV